MLTSGLSSFHPLSRNPVGRAIEPRRVERRRFGGRGGGLRPAACRHRYRRLHPPAAALTGTVGFKPSNGRVPIDPYWLGRCAGPMTRTVADAAS